ncbi:MAG TPA: homoserine dehydrogenase [Spirochaetia bacterium]|nr:homoserine dehydrogenase [Spirochaetia bacterium]
METVKHIAVAVIGCGTVGGATARILVQDREYLKARAGIDVELKYVVDRDFTNARKLGIPESAYTTDLQVALTDPDVKIVLELVGGTTIARDFIMRALTAGKHVVTANKALLAHHGPELFALARQHKVSVAFEASCGGGIPIIRAICDGLIANRIDAVYGIVNGTCNYILTEMIDRGVGYEEALADAQKAGLAEADPTLDVSGGDSAHKIAIMASLAFGKRFDLEGIRIEGIDRLKLEDVKYGMELGYVIKLLAMAQRVNDGYCLRVRPVFISHDHPLSWVSGPFNAISVYGHTTGHTMYYGRGAGGRPTGSAVVADILSIATGSYQNIFSYPGMWPDLSDGGRMVAPDELVNRFYLRLIVEDTPGVLAQIASILGNHGISIASVRQDEAPVTQSPPAKSAAAELQPTPPVHGVPVIITVHPARERNLLDAMDEISALDAVRKGSSIISIIDEHEEQIG